MWKHVEEILGIALGSALLVSLLTIPRDFVLALVPTSPLAKRAASPYPLLILFGLMVGWMSHAVLVRGDMDYVDRLRLCMRTSPQTGRPVDVCSTLDDRLMEAIALPASQCRRAFQPLDPRMEMACKDPSPDGWRL